MDQEVIVIDDEAGTNPTVTETTTPKPKPKPTKPKQTKSIKRRSTADIPTKKQTTAKKPRKNSNTSTVSTTNNTSPTTAAPSSIPTTESSHSNGSLNIAQELALNRNNTDTGSTTSNNNNTNSLPTRDVTPTPSNNMKQVKISSLLATTISPRNNRLLNPGNGKLEQQQSNNLIRDNKISDLVLKSMDLLNQRASPQSDPPTPQNIPSTDAITTNTANPSTTLPPLPTENPILPSSINPKTMLKKSKSSIPKKVTTNTTKTNNKAVSKPTKAKKSQSLTERNSASTNTESASATPKPKITAPRKKKATTTTNVTTIPDNKNLNGSTGGKIIPKSPSLQSKPSTTSTATPASTQLQNKKSTTSNTDPNSTNTMATTPTKSTLKGKNTQNSNTLKNKTTTTTSKAMVNSNTSNTTTTQTVEKKKIVPKTLVQAPPLTPPSVIKSTTILNDKNGNNDINLMDNKMVKPKIKEEKAIILDIPLYNTSSNDYLDENGTVVVNVLKLATEQENKGQVKSLDTIEQEKLKKRNLFMNQDDKNKLGNDREKTIDVKDGTADDKNNEPKKKAHPMKGKSLIGKYDMEDPFIDDTELLWDEQRAVTKDGFFVFFGPLIEKGEVPKIERATSSLKRSRR